MRVVVIGGTAAALHYGVRRATHDIDTWATMQAELAAAAEKARAATGLDVPILKSGVADAPYDFESRLERVLADLRKLTVLVPENHDLVLMKAVRCYEHDLEAIAAREITACLRQGRQFYEAAASKPLEIRPLVQYYGVTGFAKALVMATKHQRLTTLAASHGLRDASRKDGRLADLEVTIE